MVKAREDCIHPQILQRYENILNDMHENKS